MQMNINDVLLLSFRLRRRCMAQQLSRIFPVKADVGAEFCILRWLDLEFDLDGLAHNLFFIKGICTLPPWANTVSEILACLLSRVGRLQEMHLTNEHSSLHISHLILEMTRDPIFNGYVL